MIKQIVSLDYASQQIIATLPLRGKEEEFLSPNQDRATCVLNQQCKKLKGKPDDIKAVQKSVDKLFDRGHIKCVEDLSEDIQNKFINEPACWIPWRTVQNPTPVRAVMDANSKNPTILDGPGGRYLKDLTAKGRVESRILVKQALQG